MTAKLVTRTRTYTVVPRILADITTTYEVRRTSETNNIHGDAELIDERGATKNIIIGDVVRVNDTGAYLYGDGMILYCSFPATHEPYSAYQLLRKMTRGVGQGVIDVIGGDVLVLMRPAGPVSAGEALGNSTTVDAINRAMDLATCARVTWTQMQQQASTKPDNTPPRNKDWEWENQP
jgi:hypothetical protein